MLRRRQWFQIAGVAAVAAAGGAGWMIYGSRRGDGRAGGRFRHCAFDPVALENFRNPLFIPAASGPFGVLDVVGPLKISATMASFALLPGPKSQAPSPFLLCQTDHAGKAYHGLASFFLVDDDDQRRLAQALDLRLGETDLPLVIQDKQFDAQGRLHYQPNMHESTMGWLGDIVLANLTPNATHAVTRRVIDFAHDFAGDQMHLLHCHNLEHEDAGMMINFRVRA